MKLDGADQGDLGIHYEELVGGQRIERQATVDGIDVASFMYFTLNNANIARIIEATTSQWVLLLGRFKVHKEVLDELAKALEDRNYIPIVFDFERASQRDLVESIILLAGLSRLVIVDITDPQSTPMELQAIVPNFCGAGRADHEGKAPSRSVSSPDSSSFPGCAGRPSSTRISGNSSESSTRCSLLLIRATRAVAPDRWESSQARQQCATTPDHSIAGTRLSTLPLH